MVHFEDRRLVDFTHTQVLMGKSVDVEYRILRSTGEMRWARNTFRPSVNTAGRVFRVDGVVADVTEHKLAEMMLRASEQKLRVAVASFPDTIITQDKNLRFTSGDQSARGADRGDYARQKLPGYPPAPMRARPGKVCQRKCCAQASPSATC